MRRWAQYPFLSRRFNAFYRIQSFPTTTLPPYCPSPTSYWEHMEGAEGDINSYICSLGGRGGPHEPSSTSCVWCVRGEKCKSSSRVVMCRITVNCCEALWDRGHLLLDLQDRPPVFLLRHKVRRHTAHQPTSFPPLHKLLFGSCSNLALISAQPKGPPVYLTDPPTTAYSRSLSFNFSA